MKKSLIILALVMILAISCISIGICYAEDVENEEVVVSQEEVPMSEIEDAQTWFNKLWDKVEPYVMGAVSGISISGIVSALFYALIKAQTNKTLVKLEDTSKSDKQSKEIIGGVTKAISNTTLSMNIQPVVESRLKAITETIYADLEHQNKVREEKDLAVVEILASLGAYFNGSIGVSDENKEALKQAIANARALYADVEVPQVEIETKEIVVEEKVVSKKEQKVVENY